MRTWITDENGNRASIERWGSEAQARQALTTLENCSDCSDCYRCSGCSGCSDCFDCSGCSGCSDLQGASPQTGPLGAPPVPVIPDMHARIYAAASQPKALDMSDWHTCANTHCRAGWVVALAGSEGYALERFHNPELAAMLIYDASCPGFKINPSRFFDSNEEALADMEKLAGVPA